MKGYCLVHFEFVPVIAHNISPTDSLSLLPLLPHIHDIPSHCATERENLKKGC